MKILAFDRLRPGSNLTADEKYILPKARLKQGFLGVFNKAYSGDARKQFVKLALGAFMDTRAIPLGRPPKAASDEEAAKEKDRKNQFKLWEKARADEQLFKLTELRKVNGSDPHFVLGLPVLKVSYSGLNHVLSLFGAPPTAASAEEEINAFARSDQNQLFPAKLALANAGLANDISTMLSSSLLGVRVKSHGNSGQVLISLEFKISQDEAEHLVSMDWLEIRPVDLYPMLSMWVSAEYESKFYGKNAISVSKIAATLPPHHADDVRVDEFGVGIGLDGSPLYIPEKCDNTASYESLFANVGGNPDGTFSMGSLNPEENLNKLKGLPVNKPILTDWVNYKFSFTNSNGRIEVLPLEHVRRCNASMALNLMRRRYTFSQIASWEGYAKMAGVSTALATYTNEQSLEAEADGTFGWAAHLLTLAVRSNRSVKETCILLDAEFKKQSGRPYPTIRDLVTDPVFNWVWRFADDLYKGMLANLDSVYSQYAVSTITHQLGWIALIAGYGRDMGKVQMDADTANAAASNQIHDPNWVPPDAPLVTRKFESETGGMLPHQAKVRNLLKDSPAFAVLSVAAGGGKSMLSITDILYEIKAKRSAPYLIMCPSHLVANYVSEIVEFTDGLVNVIPVTSKNIRTTGYKRYEQMLETAPINTILVVDYDVLKFRARSAVYGTTAVAVFPAVELIRKFKPGYVMLDESHLLKNTSSARFKTVMSLIADIPKKRIASGTLNPDSPSDLPGQIAMMDPTIFGTKEQFNEMFAEGEYKGGRVTKWKANAGAVALSMLKANCVWAEAKRREWACALPPRRDEFFKVELTDRQREVYDALFDEMVLSIKKKAETDKNAKKLLDQLTGKKASKSDEEDFGDMGEDTGGAEEDILDDEGDVGAGLQPHLAALEQFVSDPANHPYAKSGWVTTTEDGRETRHEPLSGDDLRSPKALAMERLLKEHLSKSKSKAIVFTNYLNTAKALYEAMPPELKAQGILYTADQKTELINKFRKDPSVKWMIGIRKSMEVGLNLQQAGMLIRMEGVWNPGEQEQGDSRIARPYFGPGGDKREELRFATIVADRSIDVTKAARLRAKIVALAKFENADDPAYQAIEDIPVFKMNLDNIRVNNDFEGNLAQYAESMSHLNQVIKDDYAAYAEKIKAEGGFKFTQVKRAPNPAEARLMDRVPYAYGTELYAAADLGLVRVDNYLGMELAGEEDDEDADTDLETAEDAQVAFQRNLIIGKRCHTELGDGEITGAAAKRGVITRLQVQLDDGTTARGLHVTNVFVATRTETNGIDMRNAIAKAAGLEVTAPITVPAENVEQTRVTKKMLKEQERRKQEELKKQREADKKSKKGQKQLTVSLHLSIMNGYMRLGYTPTDASATKAMEAVGFKADHPYVYTLIRSARHLLNQANAWAEAGFNTSKEVDNDGLALLHQELASGALRSHRHYVKTVAKGGFANYVRKTWKPSPDKKLLNMFALITDGGSSEGVLIRKAEKEGEATPYAAAYLCLPLGGGFPGTMNAIKPQFKAPGTTWRRSEDQLSLFVSGFNAVRKVLQDLADAGIQVANVDELNKQARSVKKASDVVQVEGLDLSHDENWSEKEPKTNKSTPNKAEQAEKQRKAIQRRAK